jgi:hypothetical protein
MMPASTTGTVNCYDIKKNCAKLAFGTKKKHFKKQLGFENVFSRAEVHPKISGQRDRDLYRRLKFFFSMGHVGFRYQKIHLCMKIPKM